MITYVILVSIELLICITYSYRNKLICITNDFELFGTGFMPSGLGRQPLRSDFKKIATQKDVARRAGVSQSTASLVLNGNATMLRIADETRERVELAARELRYHPNAVARGLLRGRMNTIGVVMASADLDFESPAGSYCGSVITGILDVAVKRGQFVVLFPGGVWSDVRNSLPSYCDGRSDGLLLIAPPENSDITAMLLETHLPLVLIGDQSDDPRVTSVDVDNAAATQSLMTYLLELGHRRIAALRWSGFPYSVMLRLQGYREALEEYGIMEKDQQIIAADWSEDWYHSFLQPIRDLMSKPATERPTALFCFNDIIAINAIRILQEMGLRVPEDVSVVGFDDTREASTLQPPLTTVRQAPRLIGKRAAELLLSQIQDDAPPGSKEFIGTELVIRGSAGPPPEEKPKTAD